MLTSEGMVLLTFKGRNCFPTFFFFRCPDSTSKQKGESPKMGFEFDRFEKRRGQKDDRKSKAVKSIFKVTAETIKS